MGSLECYHILVYLNQDQDNAVRDLFSKKKWIYQREGK